MYKYEQAVETYEAILLNAFGYDGFHKGAKVWLTVYKYEGGACTFIMKTDDYTFSFDGYVSEEYIKTVFMPVKSSICEVLYGSKQ